MWNVIMKRIGAMALMVLGVTFLTFLLMSAAPGDAAQRRLSGQGMAVTQELIDEERAALHLTDPLMVRYGRWLSGAVGGDLGISLKDGRQVAEILWDGLPYTILLTAAALAVSLLLAVPAGIWAAVRRGRTIDRLIRVCSSGFNGIPNFLLAILLMYFFCVRWRLFPVIAGTNLRGLILPVISLSVPLTGRFIRQIRADMIRQLGSGYVAGARARGDREWFVLYKNALHNCLIGLVTALGLSAGILLGGSIVVETVFGWPGLGKVVMDAITARDDPVILGYVLYMAVIYGGISMVTDLSYRYLDPRIGGGDR